MITHQVSSPMSPMSIVTQSNSLELVPIDLCCQTWYHVLRIHVYCQQPSIHLQIHYCYENYGRKYATCIINELNKVQE